MKFTQEDVISAKKWIARYEAKVAELSAKAESCKPNQRGGYLSQVSQRRKDIERWQKTLKHREEWLAENGG